MLIWLAQVAKADIDESNEQGLTPVTPARARCGLHQDSHHSHGTEAVQHILPTCTSNAPAGFRKGHESGVHPTVFVAFPLLCSPTALGTG
jgi:hypothetical protein